MRRALALDAGARSLARLALLAASAVADHPAQPFAQLVGDRQRQPVAHVVAAGVRHPQVREAVRAALAARDDVVERWAVVSGAGQVDEEAAQVAVQPVACDDLLEQPPAPAGARARSAGAGRHREVDDDEARGADEHAAAPSLRLVVLHAAARARPAGRPGHRRRRTGR
ncbi:MAG TPA: hypothetical protein VF024_12140 [Solirubrobacteraceae bacterium]